MTEEELKEAIDEAEQQKQYIGWIQNFSKRIVSIAFIVYLVSTVYSLVLVYLSYKSGSLTGIDTFITESNTTFREVIGGYIIKSAVENAVKIGGSYFINMANIKISKARKELGLDNEDTFNNIDEELSE